MELKKQDVGGGVAAIGPTMSYLLHDSWNYSLRLCFSEFCSVSAKDKLDLFLTVSPTFYVLESDG